MQGVRTAWLLDRIAGGFVLALASSASAMAQAGGNAAAFTTPLPAAGNTTSHVNLSLPMFAAGSNSAYDLSGGAVQGTAPPAAGLPEGYTFDTFRQNIHGYVSAGVATHDGHNFAGGVEIPLVPGKLDLAVGANTGQQGGLPTYVPGGKPGTVKYDSYYASLHIHPTDDLDAYISVVGGHFRVPAGTLPPIGTLP